MATVTIEWLVALALARRVLERRRHRLDLERLDDVAYPDVAVALDRQAALVTLRDLGRVILEPPQRADLAGVDDHRITHQAQLRLAGDLAFGDEAAGDRPRLGDVEHLPH